MVPHGEGYLPAVLLRRIGRHHALDERHYGLELGDRHQARHHLSRRHRVLEHHRRVRELRVELVLYWGQSGSVRGWLGVI